jgi:hypothetical protein
MLDRVYDFDISDGFVHELASAILLGDSSSEFVLTQGKYAYRVRGGSGGHLYYEKGASDNWVLAANWCFYGLYIVVRYRKPVWLKPMYQNLFAKMNFVSATFFDHSIELVGTEGEILKGRKFRLSPPSALSKIMTENFGYTQEKLEELKATLHV